MTTFVLICNIIFAIMSAIIMLLIVKEQMTITRKMQVELDTIRYDIMRIDVTEMSVSSEQRFIDQYLDLSTRLEDAIMYNKGDAANLIPKDVAPFLYDYGRDDIIMRRIAHIKQPGFKGVFYQKIIEAQSLGLDYAVDINEDIDQIPIDLLECASVIGNLLDNAIEEAAKTVDKQLLIGAYQDGDTIIIKISNTCRDQPDIKRIFTKGYTTKGNERNHGIGLQSVNQILADNKDYMILNTTFEDNKKIITQELVFIK